MTIIINHATIPVDWDVQFFQGLVGFKWPWTLLPPNEDDLTVNTIKYNEKDYEAVMNAINLYPTSYLPTAQDKAKKRIAEIGRQKAETFPFSGQSFPLDFTTECRLDGLCRFFDRNATATEVHWDATGEGDFVTISRETGYAMFDAATQHMQACFNKRKELTDRVMAAVDINDTVFNELELNWPGDPAPTT